MAAALLKRANPNLWNEFVTAFENVRADAIDLCVQAPADQVLGKQGRAQQLKELSNTFQNCIATAENLEAKMRGASNGH